VGSLDQNETRKEHRHRDMPYLKPMRKKMRVSEKNVGWGYFSLELVFVRLCWYGQQRGFRMFWPTATTDFYFIYVAVCNIHGIPPLQWLEQWGRETERPPYRDPVLHFHAPHLIALRGRDRNGETPATGNAPRLHTYTHPTQLFAAGAQLAAQHPTRSADWPHGPCLAPAPCIPDSNS
jgi:hypothetical protein